LESEVTGGMGMAGKSSTGAGERSGAKSSPSMKKKPQL
jgi:hypothetical protein